MGRPRQSHCKRGHLMAAANVVYVGHKRHCRACRTLLGRAYRQRALARHAGSWPPSAVVQPTCPHCGQAERQIKRGHNPSGSQRFRCLWCARTYTPRAPDGGPP